MPYGIYDDRGRKIGEVRSARENAVATFLFLVVLAVLFVIFLCALIVNGSVRFLEMCWEWATTAHHITPYRNLNGVITIAVNLIVVPVVAFLLTARWERIARGELRISEEIARVVAVAFIVDGVIAGLFIALAAVPTEPASDSVALSEIEKGILSVLFMGLPIVVNAYTFFRFRLVRILGLLLVGIPLAIFVFKILWGVIFVDDVPAGLRLLVLLVVGIPLAIFVLKIRALIQAILK